MIQNCIDWLHKTRKKWSHNDDYWSLSRVLKSNITYTNSLLSQINNAIYNFSPAKRVLKSNGEMTTIWSAEDSLVLKYLAETIKTKSNFSRFVVSNKGNGGIPKAIKTVNKLIKSHKYIYRSDVKSFYDSINHKILLERLEKFTTENERNLIAKHLDRIEWQDGKYVEIKQGISKSSALSPVLGCIYLDELDRAMKSQDVKYLRYADDWIILAKTKHKLRKATKKCKQILAKLKIEEHPDKTDYRNYNHNPGNSPLERGADLSVGCGSNLSNVQEKADYRNYIENKQTNCHPSATTLGSMLEGKLNPKSRSQCQGTGMTKLSESSHNNQTTSTKPFDFLGVEFNHNGATDIKNKTKQNFSIKISRLYECIQAIAKRKNTINTEYAKGKKLYDHINELELEMIKKFIRSIKGYSCYFKSVLEPYRIE